MANQWLLWYFRFIVVFVAFENTLGIKVIGPMKPVFLHEAVNLTVVHGPGDPSSFNLKALCNNKTVPLLFSVPTSNQNFSIPAGQLSQVAPVASCVLQATDTSNKTTLASTPPFQVLSIDPPKLFSQSLPDSVTLLTTTGSTPTVSTLPSASTTSLSTANTTTSDASSKFPDSGTSQGSSTSVLRQLTQLTQGSLTTDVGVSVSGQATAIMETFTTTDSLGNVLTITSQASVNIAGGATSAPSGFTAVEKTTTITLDTGSATSIMTLTFTTNIPIQSAESSDSSNAPRSRLTTTQIAATIGGILGSLAVLALLIFLACFIRRRRRCSGPPIPFPHDPSYEQPPEKSAHLTEGTPRPVQTRHDISPTTQLTLETEDNACPEELEALTQEAVNTRRLRLQVQHLSERIWELEDQQREFGPYVMHWPYSSMEDLHPPDYADSVDSYTYTQRITHA
ncbi:hypothetical protein J132_08421 [Termitomyces sp. J132]|nr:hypothetical protein H2248_010056 [Termitomyces sp. 'cryptogamus']KNZ79944.1 hypothetical protein J132_08421 [Termitomyces sp. J132]